MSRESRTLAAVLLLAVLAGAATSGGSPGAVPPPVRKGFGEKLAVRETEVTLGPDDDLLRIEEPASLRLVEDGRVRQVVRAERLTQETWTVVVYVDPLLAPPESPFLAALALAKQSEALVENAEVELVVADPLPKVRLAATREPLLLANALVDVANEMRQRRDRTEAERPPGLAVRRLQLDRMVAFVAPRRRPAPRALFFVADGLDLPPTVINALGGDRVEPARLPEEGGARAYATAAQLLASYGWVTFPMPFKDYPAPVIRSSGIRLLDVLRRLRGMHPRRPPEPQLAEYGTDPRFAILRAMARITGGRVVGSTAAIPPAFADLPWRWHLWFAAPPVSEGRIHPLEIDLVRTDAAIRGPQWLRSGVPEELADARLRVLLGTSPPPAEETPHAAEPDLGTLRVELEVVRTRDGTTVRARLASPQKALDPSADPSSEAPVLRLSIATDAGGPPRRQLLASPGETIELAPPAGARRVAAVIEDVGGDRWGGAMAELPEDDEAPR